MQLTTLPRSLSPWAAAPSKALFAAMLASCMLVPTEAFLPGSSFAVKTNAYSCSSMIGTKTTNLNMARSENSKRTSDWGRERRGSQQEYQHGGGQEYDYSGGNLKYGTGKYTQRENDGYQGGVNISENGRSMQDAVYREDRNNVERARGRPGYNSRMDEIEDLERGMGHPREGMRDRMMRNRRSGRSGDLFDDEEGFGRGTMGFRDRMGGGGLLRDLQDAGGRNRERFGGYDDFVAPPKVMGGSSKGRGGGYRSSQFEAGLSNERRRYEEYGFRMDDYLDERDGIIDYESVGSGGSYNRRRGGDGRQSNFDRLMGRDRYDDYNDDYYGHMEDYQRGSGSRGMGESHNRNGRRGGRRGNYDDGYHGDYGDERGYGGGDGRLLRDMRR